MYNSYEENKALENGYEQGIANAVRHLREEADEIEKQPSVAGGSNYTAFAIANILREQADKIERLERL